jgi:hypothetical protein
MPAHKDLIFESEVFSCCHDGSFAWSEASFFLLGPNAKNFSFCPFPLFIK